MEEKKEPTVKSTLVCFPVSAFFEGKQHLLNLLSVNSIGYVLRFLKKLCRSLLCEHLFSNQPFQQYGAMSESVEVYEDRRIEAGRLPCQCMLQV